MDSIRQAVTRSSPLPLSGREVQIWCLSLQRQAADLARLTSLLSPDEKARAGRFYFERDRLRYIAGRGLLRTLLGRYLGIEAGRLEFCYGGYGKPALKPELDSLALQFNVSHSNDLALIIVGRERPVGIDVERLRPVDNQDRFAEQLFSARESAYLGSLAEEQRLPAFFKMWTCKEAIFKAMGDGLTRPIQEAEIALLDGESARLESISGSLEEAVRWKVGIFHPADGYQAAFAVEGHPEQVVFHPLEEDAALGLELK